MDRFLYNNTVLRILAVVLACVLWFGVNGQNFVGLSEKFPFPVHVQVGAGMIVTEINQPTAFVVVTGNLVNVSSLPAQMLGVTVVANAKGLSPGSHTVQLAAVNMPPVSYTVSPSAVKIVVERRVSESRPVEVTLEGSAASGYTVNRPTSEVKTVSVSGSSAAVQKVAAVRATVSIQDTHQSVTKLVSLTPVDGKGNSVAGVDVTPSEVIVHVPVSTPTAKLPLIPEVFGNPAPGYAIAGVDLNPPTVKVEGVLTVSSGGALTSNTAGSNGAGVNGERNSGQVNSGQAGGPSSNKAVTGSSSVNPSKSAASTSAASVSPSGAAQGSSQPSAGSASSANSAVSAGATGAGTGSSVQGLSVPIDVTGLRHNTTMNVTIPFDASKGSVVPATVKVKVLVQPSVTRTFAKLPILVTNVTKGQTVTFQKKQFVNVVVSGPKNIVSSLSPSDIQVSVDVGLLKKGTHQVPVAIAAPEWVQVTQVSTNTTTVHIGTGG